MRHLIKISPNNDSRRAAHRCNHPLALVIDPTARELNELEQMLAKCPICSQWSPGDGPIMAIVSSREPTTGDGPKDLK
jgi:hypothetical protein